MGFGGRRWLWAAGLVALLVAAIAVPVRRQLAAAALLRADPEMVLGDPVLRAPTLTAGRQVYLAHCATCHGNAGKGDLRTGTPDLTDDDHLYELDTVTQVEDVARFGIRSANKRGWNLAAMPVYASAKPYAREQIPPLSPREIEDFTQYVLWFTGRATDEAAARRGRDAFGGTAGCYDCHGVDAGGDPAIGAPTLTDNVWLYGGGHDAIYRSIARGRAGYSPAFDHVLSPLQLREVALYVASLAPSARTTR